MDSCVLTKCWCHCHFHTMGCDSRGLDLCVSLLVSFLSLVAIPVVLKELGGMKSRFMESSLMSN